MATTTKTTTKNVSTSQEENIKALRQTVERIQQDVIEIKPKKGWVKFWNLFVAGIIRGLGFVVGTTIVAGILFTVLYYVLTSTGLLKFIGDALSNVVADAIASAIENSLPF